MSMRFFFVFLELYLNTPFMFCIIKVFSLFVFLFLLFFICEVAFLIFYFMQRNFAFGFNSCCKMVVVLCSLPTNLWFNCLLQKQFLCLCNIQKNYSNDLKTFTCGILVSHVHEIRFALGTNLNYIVTTIVQRSVRYWQ